MTRQKAYIGVDVGGTYIRVGTVGTDGVPQHFEKLPQSTVFADGDPPERLCAFLADYMRRHRLTKESIAACAVGMPSCVDREKRRVLSTPNIPQFAGVALADMLEKALGLPAFLDRDVNMIYRYDRLSPELPKKGIGIGCYFGTGIGNVVEIDGRLLSGKNGVACELGHVPVMGRSDKCGCGNEGCFENYASGRYIAALCREKYPGESVCAVLTDHLEDEAVQIFIDNIAVVIATEVNLFDPHYVILGGGVLLSEGSRKDARLARLPRPIRIRYRDPGLQIFFSPTADAGGVIGAAICAHARLEGGEGI